MKQRNRKQAKGQAKGERKPSFFTNGDNLLVVESPAKAHTIQGFLGNDWTVVASKGHVRDLPEHELGVDVAHGYKPQFVVIEAKKDALERIIAAAEKSKHIYLATDPDREGESIAWHIQDILSQNIGKKPVHRVIFNAITQEDVRKAIQKPGVISKTAVRAQFARRIIDRLVGYLISEQAQIAFKKKNMAAGRVQSVALRLIVEREREIAAFKPKPYWVFTAVFERNNGERFAARLVQLESLKTPENDDEAESLLKSLKGYRFYVSDRNEKAVFKKPAPPFTTSTMQQSASRLLGLSPERCMQAAQRLYEGIAIEEQKVGLITYMRTDSVRIAPEAQARARKWIAEHYGPSYLPPTPPVYKNKDHAQDAHEAIRPTDPYRTPEQLDKKATWERPLPALYRLIWQRFIASQMAPARFRVVEVRIFGEPQDRTGVERAIFLTRGRTLLFDGYLAVYPHTQAEKQEERKESGEEELPFVENMPDVVKGEPLRLVDIELEKRWTQPPPRYTEASLIKTMESNGIGRPSTYAVILEKLKSKNYVYLKNKSLHPTELGIALSDYLVRHFDEFFSVGYTAKLEESLDRIERGEIDAVSVMDDAYRKLMDLLKRATAKGTP